jgi:hypothetical protein
MANSGRQAFHKIPYAIRPRGSLLGPHHLCQDLRPIFQTSDIQHFDIASWLENFHALRKIPPCERWTGKQKKLISQRCRQVSSSAPQSFDRWYRNSESLALIDSII